MDAILNIFTGFTLLSFFKILLVILLGVYAVFAGLMMRQIAAMTKAITMKDDYIIRILGFIHFVFASLVLLFALLL